MFRVDGSGHAFVLGTGIAGLSIAEILSRNGWRVTLLETLPDVGGDASRCTQNWLHTGWLYAGLPSASAMEGCATSLRLFRTLYGHILPGEVVNVEADEQGVRYLPSHDGWFTPEPMHYAFAVSTSDLSILQRAGWGQYLEHVILRRLARLGYPTQAARDLSPSFLELLRHWEGCDDAFSKYRVIPSTDVRVDTKRVLTSLVGLLGERTQVLTGAQYELVKQGDRTAVRINGELHTPDLCVLAAGKSIPTLLAQVGAEKVGKNFKSIASPIVVLRRALDLPNFIRFTPNLPQTINHVKYVVDGADLSTIGSYEYYPADQRPDISPFIAKVCGRLKVSTSDVIGSYYGTKTEFTGGEARRYNHALGAVNANTYFAIAGKFSQFPLLAHEFATELGLRTDIRNDTRGSLVMNVGDTAPERLAHAAAKRTAA